MFDPSKACWSDDFIGIAVDPRYHISCAPGGLVKPSASPSIGGWLHMACNPVGGAAARIRIGDDPKVSPYDAMPFSASKNVIAKARLKINMAVEGSAPLAQVTVGFVGRNDPDNVIAALFGNPAAPENVWSVQTRKGGNGINSQSSFRHTPGATFEIELRTTPASATMLINGAPVVATDQFITDSVLAFEFQLWNKPIAAGGYSSPAMWIDYLHIEQGR